MDGAGYYLVAAQLAHIHTGPSVVVYGREGIIYGYAHLHEVAHQIAGEGHVIGLEYEDLINPAVAYLFHSLFGQWQNGNLVLALEAVSDLIPVSNAADRILKLIALLGHGIHDNDARNREIREHRVAGKLCHSLGDQSLGGDEHHGFPVGPGGPGAEYHYLVQGPENEIQNDEGHRGETYLKSGRHAG